MQNWGESTGSDRLGKMARPVNIAPPISVEQIKEGDRPFDQARVAVDDCFCELKHAVNTVRTAFAPVIGPERPECEKIQKDPTGPTSDWSAFVGEICTRIRRCSEELRDLSKRSEV